MYGFGAYGQYAFGEVPQSVRVVTVAVGFAVLAAPAGAAKAVERPAAAMAMRAGESAGAKGAETARPTIAAQAAAVTSAHASGSRNLAIPARPAVAPAATQIEYVLRDVRTIRAPGAFGEMAFGQGSRTEIFRTGVAFAAVARAADAATSKVQDSASFAAVAAEAASPHAREIAAASLGAKDSMTVVPGVASLRGATVGVKAGLAEFAAAIGRRASVLSGTFAAASVTTARKRGAAALGAVAAEHATLRGIEEAAVVFAASESISDRAPAEREPVTVVGMAAKASLSGVARAIANRAAMIAAQLGEAPRATQNAARTGQLDTVERIAPAGTATTHGQAPFDTRDDVAGTARRVDLVGRSFTTAERQSASETATAHGSAALGTTERLAPHPAATETGRASLATSEGETARANASERAHGVIPAIATAAGRFSVSIRARTLGAVATQGGSPAAITAAHAGLGASAGSSSATPSPRSARVARLVGAFGVLPALIGSGRVAASLSLLAAWFGRRFFDLREARRLKGRGSRAAFTGSASREQVDGRATRGTFTGSEL